MGAFSSTLAVLRTAYGSVEPLEPCDAFGLIVWENCAYLVDDDRRARTYASLEKTVGIDPLRLLAAGARAIESAIAEGGMKAPHRAAKVLKCAEIAVECCDGDLAGALDRGDEKSRRRLLKRFPGIADPGADKILLFCGYSEAPALDSNGLRVLERLGAIAQHEAYAASYRDGVSFLSKGKVDGREAFTLLREHGRTLCKRTNPRCFECPLCSACPSSTSL